MLYLSTRSSSSKTLNIYSHPFICQAHYHTEAQATGKLSWRAGPPCTCFMNGSLNGLEFMCQKSDLRYLSMDSENSGVYIILMKK